MPELRGLLQHPALPLLEKMLKQQAADKAEQAPAAAASEDREQELPGGQASPADTTNVVGHGSIVMDVDGEAVDSLLEAGKGDKRAFEQYLQHQGYKRVRCG